MVMIGLQFDKELFNLLICQDIFQDRLGIVWHQAAPSLEAPVMTPKGVDFSFSLLFTS